VEAPRLSNYKDIAGEPTLEKETSQKSKMSIAAFLILGAALSPLLYFGIHGSAVSMDNKAKVLHADCEVLDKSQIKDDLYLIKTSCGEYEAIPRMSGFVEVGQRYDMKVTEGNWAQSPRLKVANGSCECSSTPPKPNPPKPAPPTPNPTPIPEPLQVPFPKGGGKEA
jgi:hypothetical protein